MTLSSRWFSVHHSARLMIEADDGGVLQSLYNRSLLISESQGCIVWTRGGWALSCRELYSSLRCFVVQSASWVILCWMLSWSQQNTFWCSCSYSPSVGRPSERAVDMAELHQDGGESPQSIKSRHSRLFRYRNNESCQEGTVSCESKMLKLSVTTSARWSTHVFSTWLGILPGPPA